MKIFSLDKIAFEALQQVRDRDGNPDALRNAALSLAHHLRAHGLSATIGYGMGGTDSIKSITHAFVGALHQASPIAGKNNDARAITLMTEDHATYLLHSNLALALANGIALAARALWPTSDSATQQGASA